MPSELQRVAQGLVDCLDQVPGVVEHLRRTADWCRQQAAFVADLSGGDAAGWAAALQLQAAAEACDEAAHYASLAPPKARHWAASRVGGAGATRAADAGDPPPSAHVEERPLELSTSNPDHRELLNGPPPNSKVVVDERFTYETDHLGRVIKASATLDAIDLDYPRDTRAQRMLVGKLPGDHAGHIFARIFQGPGQTINLSPMAGGPVNQGKYRTLENRWKAIVDSGGTVDVEVDFHYDNDARRPDRLRIAYRHGDDRRIVRISNNPITAEDEG